VFCASQVKVACDVVFWAPSSSSTA
jgi:hypothetical protein